MIKEAPVFDRSDRIHKIGRQLVIGHQAALGAVLPFREPRDHLRLQLISVQLLRAVAGDPADHPLVKRDRSTLLRVVRLRARLNPDAVIVERIGPHARPVAITIAAVARVA